MPFFGKKHHNWKGGLPNCLVCGIQISRGCKRCWEHKIVKRAPKLTLKRFLLDKDIQNKRFWTSVTKTNNCWVWKRAKRGSNNYGSFSIGYKTYFAHRISWLLHYGDIPKDKYVLHKCDNPLCVRPDHLFLGTNQDNADDMVNKKRQCFGEKQSNHKLTEEQVLEIRSLYKTTKYTMYTLADMFGVTRPQIGHIIHRVHWKYI